MKDLTRLGTSLGTRLETKDQIRDQRLGIRDFRLEQSFSKMNTLDLSLVGLCEEPLINKFVNFNNYLLKIIENQDRILLRSKPIDLFVVSLQVSLKLPKITIDIVNSCPTSFRMDIKGFCNYHNFYSKLEKIKTS